METGTSTIGASTKVFVWLDQVFWGNRMTCSPKGMICCFLCHRPFRMMLPYTSTSLKRKKTLGCSPLRLCFISRPSPIKTRPGRNRGFPDGPNEFSTVWIRSQFSWENASWSTMASSNLRQQVFNAAVALPIVLSFCCCVVSCCHVFVSSLWWESQQSRSF